MIFNSSILSMNKTNDIEALKYRKVKIIKFRGHKFNISNNDITNLSLINKFKNRRILNEKYLFKSKLKINDYHTNFYDYSNPLKKNDFSSSEKIIKKAKEFRNTTNNSFFFKDKDKSASTFLTENKSLQQKILPYINFNPSLNEILLNNSLCSYSNKSVSNLKLKNRIQWKFNYINNLCKNLIEIHERNNFFERFDENVKKSELIYRNYNSDMKNYLSFLNDIIIKEEDYTYKLKNKKRNIVESIKHLNEKIEKYKNIKNQCLDIKNFLLKVKGGNPNKNLSPLKEIKKRLDIIQLTDIRKTPKKMENKFKLELTSDKKINNHYTTKKLKIFNHLIFSDPDEFMSMYEEKMINIRNKINFYNKTNSNVILLKKDKEKKLIDNPPSEEKIDIDIDKYYSKFNSLKSTNIELRNKLYEYKNFKKIKNKGFKILEIKLRSIILNINSFLNLKKLYFTEFKSIHQVLDLNEQGKNKNLHLLKILEIITDLVIAKDKKYKEEPKLKYIYSKIKSANEQIKFELIRIEQVNKMKKKEEEKNKKILEYHRKTRIIPFNKNGINLKYFHKIKHLNIHSKQNDELINKENKKKNDEIINLISYS